MVAMRSLPSFVLGLNSALNRYFATAGAFFNSFAEKSLQSTC
jgi:hypothetical protein